MQHFNTAPFHTKQYITGTLFKFETKVDRHKSENNNNTNNNTMIYKAP